MEQTPYIHQFIYTPLWELPIELRMNTKQHQRITQSLIVPPYSQPNSSFGMVTNRALALIRESLVIYRTLT